MTLPKEAAKKVFLLGRATEMGGGRVKALVVRPLKTFFASFPIDNII